MNYYRYVILGAGPAGLSFAHTLLDRGETSFIVIEKESVPGGLCRSTVVDGAPIDIGGGHFLDVKNQDCLDFLFRFMPKDEWQEFNRISKIHLNDVYVDYPLEANIWQLPIDEQVNFLESIAQAGCVKGEPTPETFTNWICWKLGERIASNYMIPYNRKIWSTDFEMLGTYWLNKLPNVSFRDIVKSCLEKKAFGTIPAHKVFLYPKRHGFGEVWRRMGAALGDRLRLSCPVDCVDIANRSVNREFCGEVIVNTIPWSEWPNFAVLPDQVVKSIKKLKHISIDVDYYPDTISTDAHWIYEPSEALSYHRVLCRSNFCLQSNGYWTESNATRSCEQQGWRHTNNFAYPLNAIDKPKVIEQILCWAMSVGIVGLGRWGTWEHLNSDIAVLNSCQLAEELLQSAHN